LGPADLARAGQIFDESRAQAAALGFRLNLPRLAAPGELGGARGCSWPSEQLYLTAAGDMLPCCMVATADRASFGRVADAPGALAAVWQGDAARGFRAALESDAPPSVCRSCALYEGRF
jgi:radical SAM protein with 4Fe4S-binding SPASM domain